MATVNKKVCDLCGEDIELRTLGDWFIEFSPTRRACVKKTLLKGPAWKYLARTTYDICPSCFSILEDMVLSKIESRKGER